MQVGYSLAVLEIQFHLEVVSEVEGIKAHLHCSAFRKFFSGHNTIGARF